jgi:hypothetical protein
MPRIFDNIDQQLLPALCQTIDLSERADFCVGYFNLRGWKQLDGYIDRWSGGEGHCCRLLVGMQCLPQDELRDALRLIRADEGIDNQTALRLKKRLAEEFRMQLTIGAPSNEDERGLRQLATAASSTTTSSPTGTAFISATNLSPRSRCRRVFVKMIASLTWVSV